MVTMIADETTPQPLDEPQNLPLAAANDNNDPPAVAIDPDILTIASAIGRQIAREEMMSRRAANDNNPEDPA
jgi:hypothetical protein